MSNKRLCRSKYDCVLFGVCGGIAKYFGISSFLVRVLFILFKDSLIIYLVLALILPVEYEL